MVDDNIEDAKAALRLTAHAARATLTAAERAEAAQSVTEHFFAADLLRREDSVAAYWRIRDELDCQPILVRLMDSGHKVILPVVTGPDAPLDLRVWEPGTPLYEAGFNTLAPDERAPRAEPDIILMPLLAFDRLGTRLGYGGGYYDRTIAKMHKRPRLIGLAYTIQELAFIPREPHDVPLDAVITEAGVRSFGAGA